jgi:uncharacterized protein (DUF1800 family)
LETTGAVGQRRTHGSLLERIYLMKKLFCLFAATLFLSNCGAPLLAATNASNKNAPTNKGAGNSGQVPVDADPDIIHILNRAAFGPRPGDIEHVRQVGIQRYIDEQLNPQAQADPLVNDERFRMLNEGPRRLIQQFQEVRKQAKQLKQADKQGDSNNATASNNTDNAEAKRAIKRFYMETEGASKSAKLERAIDSPNQLLEVMVDFWYNHFNVYTGKGIDRVLCGPYEQQAIRPYALGRFRDLLGATCHHPAMLFYLDNWQNTDPKSNGARTKKTGLNENYARELMELHTLGVDGGYTQKDVVELARILTGLGLAGFRARNNPNIQMVGEYGAAFDANRHDFSDKILLGHRIKGGGEEEVEQALDLLVAQPATAHHIAFQLAQYFVADNPPPSLVNRLAQRFQHTDGNIKLVMQTLLSSQEFWDPKYEHSKYKSPFRYVVSTMRASGLPGNRSDVLNQFLQQQGEPIYGCLTPDGYKNTKDAWMNPDALLRRLNFATAIGNGNLQGYQFDPPEYRTLGDTISGGKFSSQTVATIAKQPEQLRSALLLGSPEFMRY